MFRTVGLPVGVAGHLLLHSMPGRYEAYAEACRAIDQCGVTRVVCLAPLAEIQANSPAYAQALEAGRLPWRYESVPVSNYGVPEDCQAFWQLAQRLAAALQAGEAVLIHCGAGVGRTGTLAICVLLALGLPLDPACAAVLAAGSCPETAAQLDLVSWAATQGNVSGAED